MKTRTTLFIASSLCLISFLSAQTNRNELLSRDVLEKIGGEISGKACFENIRKLGVYSRYYGSDDQLKAAEFVVAKAKQYGLADARIEKFLVDRETYYGMQKPYPAWNCTSGELRLIKPSRRLITTTEAINTCVLAYSRDADVEAEVISVGQGTEESDYQGKDVRGKIVLAYGYPFEVSKIAVLRMGAAGILYGQAKGSLADAVPQISIKPWNEDRTKNSTFGFALSVNQTRSLEEILARGEKVVVQARVRAEVRMPGFHYGVTATLPGSTYPGEEIILTAHLDHPSPGAHDDNSGCAVLLEVARALKILADDKSIERPKRTLRFYWTPHVWGADMLLAAYPELLKKTVAGINVDCVGIDQTKVSSAFSVIMPPFSRASFLDDVFANLLHYVAICNNSQWTRVNYGLELRDQDGSGNVFYGRIVPYMGFSDHVFFNSGSVGIPAVMLIDLPFIAHHTQKDDLNLLDPTELKRISFLSAAGAYTIAVAGPREAPGIVDEIYHRGRIRLETEMKLAKGLLRDATKDNATRTFMSVDNLIVQGFKREIRALRSTKLFIKGDIEAVAYLAKMTDKLGPFEKESRRDLEDYYRRTCGILGISAMAPRPTDEELALKQIVPKPNPRLIGTLGLLNEYPADKYVFPKLGSLVTFSYELLNLMDGKRNMFEILQEVQAEALSSNFQTYPIKDIMEFVEALKASLVISY
jgi:aminopeptidase YwaD